MSNVHSKLQKKWCNNCLNRIKIDNEILCSLTNKKANFYLECPSFLIDQVQAIRSDKNGLFKKYTAGDKEPRIREIKIRRRYQNKKLPNKIRIVNKQVVYSVYLATPLFILLVGIYDIFNVEKAYALPIGYIVFGAIVSSIFAVLIAKHKRKQEAIIQFTPEGLIYDNKNYDWNQHQFFELNNDHTYILVKKPLEREVLIPIGKLEFYPKKIFSILEFHRQKYSNT